MPEIVDFSKYRDPELESTLRRLPTALLRHILKVVTEELNKRKINGQNPR